MKSFTTCVTPSVIIFGSLPSETSQLVQVRLRVAQKKRDRRLGSAVGDLIEIRKVAAKLDHDPTHNECVFAPPPRPAEMLSQN